MASQEELEKAKKKYEDLTKKLLHEYEEKSKIQSTQDELKSLSKQGNVDLTIRPVIDYSAMKEAGWDVEDGSIATTFTQGEFIWQGGEWMEAKQAWRGKENR